MQIELRSRHEADALEARDTAEHPLQFRCEESDLDKDGAGVILYSQDGCVFLGKVVEVDPDTMSLYVELT